MYRFTAHVVFVRLSAGTATDLYKTERLLPISSIPANLKNLRLRFPPPPQAGLVALSNGLYQIPIRTRIGIFTARCLHYLIHNRRMHTH